MHIVLCHDALIPPRKYGGTERIVYWLGKALLELGHKVTLIAQKGSEIPGADVLEHPLNGGSVASLIPNNADIVNFCGTPRENFAFPFLVTIHGNGQPGERFHRNSVFVSRKHAENHGSQHFVHNGIDPDAYPCDEKREETLVFLAKASWSVKNLKGAVEIARRAGLPLEVLGSRDWPLGLQRALPRWRGVRYHGMADDTEKTQILRRARALLFPVRWDEPFGIAITEALASGCAVFGTPYGSLPEIVTPDTGLLSAQATEHVATLRSRAFSPARCRERVFEGFTYKDMAKKYLMYYEKILSDRFLSEAEPVRQNAPTGLLPWHFT